MALANAIHTILKDNATVASLVSTRIYPVEAPQNAEAPYIVFSRISHDPHDTKSGVSKMDFVRVQIESYAGSYDTALSIDNAVRAALDRFSGTAGSQAVTSIRYLTTMETKIWEVELFLIASDYQVMVPYS